MDRQTNRQAGRQIHRCTLLPSHIAVYEEKDKGKFPYFGPSVRKAL